MITLIPDETPEQCKARIRNKIRSGVAVAIDGKDSTLIQKTLRLSREEIINFVVHDIIDKKAYSWIEEFYLCFVEPFEINIKPTEMNEMDS